MTTTRRAALTGLAALPLLSGGLAAFPAWADDKLTEVGKVFRFYDLYLGIPAADRTRFSMAYFFVPQKGSAPLGITMIGPNGARTPLPVGPDGRVQRLPTLADFKAKAKLEFDAVKGASYKGEMMLLARVTPAATLAAADLNAAIAQCQKAIKAKAGLIGFAVPKIKRVALHGAGSGTAIDAKGGSRPLPVHSGVLSYDPELMPGIVTLKLARAPTRIELDERPKK